MRHLLYWGTSLDQGFVSEPYKSTNMNIVNILYCFKQSGEEHVAFVAACSKLEPGNSVYSKDIWLLVTRLEFSSISMVS